MIIFFFAPFFNRANSKGKKRTKKKYNLWKLLIIIFFLFLSSAPYSNCFLFLCRSRFKAISNCYRIGSRKKKKKKLHTRLIVWRAWYICHLCFVGFSLVCSVFRSRFSTRPRHCFAYLLPCHVSLYFCLLNFIFHAMAYPQFHRHTHAHTKLIRFAF